MINAGIEPTNFLNDLLEIIYFIQQIKFNKFKIFDLSAIPNILLTKPSSISFSSMSCETSALSKRDNESLTDPSAAFAINISALSDIFPFSIFKIFLRFANKSLMDTLCKSNL
jgi:hypothetical protein